MLAPFLYIKIYILFAGLAQLVEHRYRKPAVTGSSPAAGIKELGFSRPSSFIFTGLNFGKIDKILIREYNYRCYDF